MKHIAILDFGSQYTHLITRRIREFDVLAKIYPHDISADNLPTDVIGIILSGGPQSVYDDHAITVDKNIFELNKPVLGICYGHQLMGQLLGGEVKPGKVREYGRAQLRLEADSAQKNRLFENITDNSIVWMSHGDSVSNLPSGFHKVAETDDCPITAMADEKHRFYGLQFHPEVDHTEHGVAILKNFVLHICQAEQNWRIEDVVADLQDNIRRQVGDKKVFILVSGGVDSSVAFALLTKTLGEDRVRGLYIDTGFMRADESEEIQQGFADSGMRNFTAVDASETFFHNLKNIYEPEQKRAIIGQTFLTVKNKETKKLGLNARDWLLGQGTIYPDIIESGGSQNADKIKTHHNRIPAIQKLIAQGLVIEPLVDFYKYEVRQIGRLLKLPPELVDRQPFPGPGLAIRCLCHNSKSKPAETKKIERHADLLLKQKFPNVNFALLPIRSVGVQGDQRTYAHPLAIWGENNWSKLDQISVSMTNTIREINRLVLWLNPKAQKEFFLPAQNLYLTPERIRILRLIDHLVIKHISQAELTDQIMQFPVVLIPITDATGRESIVLRPVCTRDFMTLDFYHLAPTILKKIVQSIEQTGLISHIFYDITNKPPGTTEWE